jgi:hypothetical protein
MPVIDYSKTKIYKIQCRDKSVQDVFYGHCIKIYHFKYKLKTDIANGKDTYICNTIRENGGIGNWHIIVMESYTECQTKEQAKYRVAMIETQNNPAKPIPLNPTTIPMNTLNPETPELFNCNMCNKTFTLKTNLTRHRKNICNKSTTENDFETTIQLQLNKLEEHIKEQNDKIKEQDDKIKRLEEQIVVINTQNNHNVNNPQNNIIFELGNENFKQVLTDEQKLQILNQKYESIEYFIKKYNCNKDYPQFQNVKITSMTKSHCKAYSKNDKKYIAKDMKYTIEKLVDYRIRDLHIMLDETPNVPEDTNIAVRGLLDKMVSDEKYKKEIYKTVKMTMYSESCDS